MVYPCIPSNHLSPLARATLQRSASKKLLLSSYDHPFKSYFTNLNSKAIWGWFPLLTMIPGFGRTVRSWWNLPRFYGISCEIIPQWWDCKQFQKIWQFLKISWQYQSFATIKYHKIPYYIPLMWTISSHYSTISQYGTNQCMCFFLPSYHIHFAI